MSGAAFAQGEVPENTCVPTLLALEGHVEPETLDGLWNAVVAERRRQLAARGLSLDRPLADLATTGVALVNDPLQEELLLLGRPAPTTWETAGSLPYEAWLENALARQRTRGQGHRLVLRYPASVALPPRGWLRSLLPRLRRLAETDEQTFVLFVEPRS